LASDDGQLDQVEAHGKMPNSKLSGSSKKNAPIQARDDARGFKVVAKGPNEAQPNGKQIEVAGGRQAMMDVKAADAATEKLRDSAGKEVAGLQSPPVTSVNQVIRSGFGKE